MSKRLVPTHKLPSNISRKMTANSRLSTNYRNPKRISFSTTPTTGLYLPPFFSTLNTMTLSKGSEFINVKPVTYPTSYKSAVDKLSNIELSEEQLLLKDKILGFVRNQLHTYKKGDKSSLFVIQGDAGTGKSVILNALFNEIQRIAKKGDDSDVLYGKQNYLVVNHPEMLKLYHRIAASFDHLAKKDLERPTSLINRLNKEKKTCDVVIVDEAHLLATSKNGFKRFFGDNHLEELMKLAKVLIIVYDDKQSLRMDQYWSSDGKNGSSLDSYLTQAKYFDIYNLQQQFRVAANQDVQDWIYEISTSKKILPLPTQDLVKRMSGDDDAFEFKIWDDCLEMYQCLQEKDKEYGQCRMLSTYDFPYRIGNKDWFVTCGDFKLRWDRFAPTNRKPWSERPDTIEEVGSVYTIQGFDLNYAGVILGRSIAYDEKTDSIKILPEYYDDHAGFTRRKNIVSADSVKEKIILNSINVLLTRGVRGLYIYAWDEKLRARLNRLSTDAGLA
ncbi:unnamed protein product [Ambrosiozyma monospora]|uniref:Unnamed protein product n=1 Tax=Ambrosiozyma monospora TaxID=43982 RepID=A0A9W7DJ64_AMBMO|nr:unnamed protein product [Ambrosiozyma monospora]